jgi:hypothetical protein
MPRLNSTLFKLVSIAFQLHDAPLLFHSYNVDSCLA